MAGVSDIGFRHLCTQFGAGLTYTEMVSATALFYKNKKTEKMLIRPSNEKVSAVQLFGKTPEHFAYAVKHPLVAQFDIIDINMGCPASKIIKNGEGSALMKNLPLAKQIIETCVKNSSRPITVKFRAGWDENNINAVEFAKMAQSAGASALTIHGRTTKQMYSGKADRNIIKQVVNAVNIPVIANGDVNSRESFLEMLNQTGASAVMIGRASFGRPWLFAEILNKKAVIDKQEVISLHTKLLTDHLGERIAEKEMKKHLFWYKKHLDVS